jgi:hypothetical protein
VATGLTANAVPCAGTCNDYLIRKSGKLEFGLSAVRPSKRIHPCWSSSITGSRSTCCWLQNRQSPLQCRRVWSRRIWSLEGESFHRTVCVSFDRRPRSRACCASPSGNQGLLSVVQVSRHGSEGSRQRGHPKYRTFSQTRDHDGVREACQTRVHSWVQISSVLCTRTQPPSRMS